MSNQPVAVPLWDAQETFYSDLIKKVSAFLQWLTQTGEFLQQVSELQPAITMIYEQPYTPGGPFTQVPKAILSGLVIYKGKAFAASTSGKTPERRAVTISLQTMQSVPSPQAAALTLEHRLIWYARTEEELFKLNGVQTE